MKFAHGIRGICAMLGVVLVNVMQPAFGLAWGEEGHKITGEIAERYLSPRARDGVKKILGERTLADVSTWADAVRTIPAYAYAKPLHYMDVKPGAEGPEMARDCKDGACVVGAIEKYSGVLRDSGAGRREREEALKFLVHFVGDLHQPLHVSRESDEGGNKIEVEFFGRNTNLHHVWDTSLLQHAKRNWRDYSESLIKTITRKDRREWRGSKPLDWAGESYRYALESAYAIPEDKRLGEEYFAKNLPVVEERLKQGGVRLSGVLNDIFAER